MHQSVLARMIMACAGRTRTYVGAGFHGVFCRPFGFSPARGYPRRRQHRAPGAGAGFFRPARKPVGGLRSGTVNGLDGPRRSARPVRVVLAKQLGADIDGAWWPNSASLATELPNLVAALQRPLGEIVEIRLNWSETEGQLDLDVMVAESRWATATRPKRPRLIRISGRTTDITLLVVPPKTSLALGVLVMRCAAVLPIDDADRGTTLFATADSVMDAALSESARWARPMHRAAAEG